MQGPFCRALTVQAQTRPVIHLHFCAGIQLQPVWKAGWAMQRHSCVCDANTPSRAAPGWSAAVLPNAEVSDHAEANRPKLSSMPWGISCWLGARRADRRRHGGVGRARLVLLLYDGKPFDRRRRKAGCRVIYRRAADAVHRPGRLPTWPCTVTWTPPNCAAACAPPAAPPSGRFNSFCRKTTLPAIVAPPCKPPPHRAAEMTKELA